jgi:hypothetical protein
MQNEITLQATPDGPTTVWGVIADLICHPGKHLIERWNWKSALTSSAFRCLIYFSTNVVAGLRAALAAMTIEFLFRGVTSGFYGSLTQAFTRAQPAWAGSLAVIVILPAVGHSMEFMVHWLGGTRKLAASVIASVAFTAVSSLFNLFAMRRGVLTVGQDCNTLKDDFRRMPRIVFDFVLAIPRSLFRMLAGLARDSM